MKKKIYSFILAILILAILFIFVDVNEVLSQLSQVRIRYLLLAIVLTIASLFIKSYRWVFLLKKEKQDLGLISSFMILTSSRFLLLFSPNIASDFYRAYALKKISKIKYEFGLVTSVFEKIIHFIIIFFIGFSLLLFYAFYKNISMEVGAIFLIILFILAVLIIMIYPKSITKLFEFLIEKKKLKKSSKPNKWRNRFKDAAIKSQKYLEDRKLIFSVILITLLSELFMVWRIHVLTYALGIDLMFYQTLIVYFISVVAGIISMLPSGIGSKEGAMMFVFAYFFGLTASQGMTLALLNRAVFLIMVLIFGCFFYYVNRKIIKG